MNTKSLDSNWLTPELQSRVRQVFEPRYKRQLTDEEVVEIAINLSDVVEEIAKFTWLKKYEHGTSKITI